jgi:predicted SnoaL-like aldol condensation-catalyzing enzyme
MSPSPDSALEANKHLLLRWLDELWNQGRHKNTKELFAANVVLHHGHREAHGPAEFLHFCDRMRARFSQFSLKPIIVLAEADLVCVHWSMDCLYTATHTPIHITGNSIARVVGGQIVEAWQNWDATDLTQQRPGFTLP